ncbi:riboflavin synthase [Rubrivirga marina]|uniref:Riboflavin synthase n=1 Tax=Rubrivirga marina TaxID=1196024 RepID=A0A271IZG7_9BACT|nr:riboflavin synthase [Rubrivirga marina]PAP76467.1 riboflavin synthase subunit alpha [Rubrivirga marina]
MFTGIIEEVGTLADVTPLRGGRRLRIACSFADALRVDESVAVDGVCLTVVAQDGDAFEAVAVEETLSKTALGDREAGDGVNLERAMVLGARLDGHLVQGHVDATGTVDSVEALADSHLVRIRYPDADAAYLIPRGSICVDGISLTVARLDEPEGTFALAIIPHTWDKTTAGQWRKGERVNLEFDLVGKYVLRAQGVGATNRHR